MTNTNKKLTTENFSYCFLNFRDRQAGVSTVYDPDTNLFRYNAYCVERKLVTELYSREFAFLEDALAHCNTEFGNWELQDLSAEQKDCGNCDNAR